MAVPTALIIHDITSLLSVPIAAAFGVWYAPKYGYSRKKGASYAFVMMFLFLVFAHVCYMVPGWFGINVSKDSYRSFLLAPLFAWAMSRIWKIPTLHGVDFITPIVFFRRAIGMVGCTILGCARAIPCDWGIYSPNRGCRVFPMDLIEMLGALVAAVVALIYAKKLMYDGNGRIFAISMYIMGFAKLFIQLGSAHYWWIRGFNEKSVYSIVAIIMTIVIDRIGQKNNLNKNKQLNGGT